jgi:hypothetical protein
MEELVGKFCKGFYFKETLDAIFLEEMECYIGEPGKILKISQDEYALISFNIDATYWYPLDQVKDHLVETVPSQKVLTPLDKLMSFLIDKQYFIGNDLYEEFKKLKEEEKELFFTIACRGIYGMSSESDAKKFIDEKFE